jgi:phosphoglycerate dehydrogenase-like enzyme
MRQLPTVGVLVTMAFTPEMGAVGRRLKLVQVPGAGLDRIDRAALPTGTWLANAYGHETGIAEYVIGARLALTRDFARLDARLRQGQWESQLMTPHVSGWTESMREVRAQRIADNIHRVARGEPPVQLIPASVE